MRGMLALDRAIVAIRYLTDLGISRLRLRISAIGAGEAIIR